MWPAFFALVRPVTRNANPTCMNSTRKPVISSQVKLIEIPSLFSVSAVVLASLLIPTCDNGTFDAVIGKPVPVLTPLGSAWWLNWPITTRATNTTIVINKSFLPRDTSAPLGASGNAVLYATAGARSAQGERKKGSGHRRGRTVNRRLQQTVRVMTDKEQMKWEKG